MKVYTKFKILKTIKKYNRYTERNTVHFSDQDFSSETMQDTLMIMQQP